MALFSRRTVWWKIVVGLDVLCASPVSFSKRFRYVCHGRCGKVGVDACIPSVGNCWYLSSIPNCRGIVQSMIHRLVLCLL